MHLKADSSLADIAGHCDHFAKKFAVNSNLKGLIEAHRYALLCCVLPNHQNNSIWCSHVKAKNLLLPTHPCRSRRTCLVAWPCYSEPVIRRFILALALSIAAHGASGAIVQAQGTSVRQPPRAAAAPAKPWLGIAFGQGPRGVLIDEVIPDSPADVAGILVGDVVTAVGDRRTPTSNALLDAVQAHAVGDQVLVVLRRHGRALSLQAELTTRLEPAELLRRRLVDKVAPEFSLTAIHGLIKGDLSLHRGKVVVLEFWSGGCKVCTESIEPLANLQAENLGDLVVLGITSDHESRIQRFLSNNSMPISLLSDQDWRVHRLYRFEGIVPTVVVIGRDGLVRYADTGSEINMDSVVLSAKRAVRERSL